MLTAFLLLGICLGIMAITTVWFPQPVKDEARLLIWEDWREPLRGQAHGRGLGNYRLASVAVLATFVVLYAVFR
jgi:hypothetical protein